MDIQARLITPFTLRFKAVPEVCRAPGRVNLIGEHTDYNGLPVLPMTLSEAVYAAFAPREDSLIQVLNDDPAFPDSVFKVEPNLPPSPAGAWENYVKAAVQALNNHFGPAAFPGMNMYVAGDLPREAGLSSSSALVIASALAYLRCLGQSLERDIPRLDLAAVLADAEHYVGTQGGGMDQAVILGGRAGHACKIDFFPLRVETVPLLPRHSFVVCDSLVRVPKSGPARRKYNAGPALCRLIRALVQCVLREEFGEEVTIDRLGDLWYGHLCLTHDEVAGLFDKAFPRERTTLHEACAALGMPEETLREQWLQDLEEPPGGFPLRARARHQLTEYKRVEEARDALYAGDPVVFGRLMNASHESCAVDYAISCPELDALTACARGGGALGARLTGAGFGGCTVNLVPDTQVDAFFAHMEQTYYAPRGITCSVSGPASPMRRAQAGDPADYLPARLPDGGH